MNKQDKQLLLKDLCARLPYGVRMKDVEDTDLAIQLSDFGTFKKERPIQMINRIVDEGWLPYLRPMSSMTEEEKEELYRYYCKEIADNLNTPNLTWELRCCVSNSFGTDWLNAHHFDYRGLIKKGLALEAPEDMYK